MIMQRKNSLRTAEFWCFFVAIAEFILFLLWGMNMRAGDEMGFTLITVYAAIPLTSLILCAILANKRLAAAVVLAILMVLIEIFFPFFIFGTFEIPLCLALSVTPCAVGLLFGYMLSKRK